MDVFFIGDDQLLETYNNIWKKVSNSIKKELDCEPIYDKKFWKTRIMSSGNEATDFYNKGVPTVGSNYTCLVVVFLDSVLKKDENYYPQAFLKECKYIE